MQSPPSRRPALALGLTFAAFAALSASACGAQVSTLDHACPCESGWTCCADDVCVPPGASCGPSSDASANQCPAGVTLGNQTLPTFGPDGDVQPFPASLSMDGQILATFPGEGGTMAFDYATSAELARGRVTQRGWMVVGGNSERYRFKAWAQEGSTTVPLQLIAYGPIELGPAGNGDCFGTLVGGGPLPLSDGTFAPPLWGRYFVAAYHALDVAPDGTVSIQSLGGAPVSRAFLTMAPLGD